MKSFPLVYPIITLISLSSCSSSTTKPEKSLVKAPELPEETILQNGIATYDEGLFKVSLSSWSELRDGYPTSYYSTLAEIKIADAHFFSGDYPAALVAYEEFAKLHPGHEAMPYIRYQIGNCSFKQYKDILHDQAPLQTALKSYELLLEQHPKSEYVVLARRQIDRCKELQAAYEKYVAEFYSRKGLELAASSRMEKLATDFPGTKTLEELKETKHIPLGESQIPSGKIPKTPSLVSTNLLNETHYTENLRTLKGRQKKIEVLEEQLLETKKEEPNKITPSESNSPTENELLELACEESPSGAIFIVTTLSEVVNDPGNSKESYEFKWINNKEANATVSTSELCSAAGITLEAKTDSTALFLRFLPQMPRKINFVVLNRPNRVVFSVN